MSENKNIVLGEQSSRFIDTQIDKGNFANPAEVVEAGLRLLQDQEQRLQNLRNSIDAAKASIAAGKGKSCDNPSHLVESIISRGQEKLKQGK